VRQGFLTSAVRASFVAGTVAAALISAPAAAQVRETGARLDARFGTEFTETVSRTFPAAGPVTLNLSNESGDVVITGGPGSEVRVEAVKRVRQQSEPDARTLLQKFLVNITERNGVVEVRTEFPPEGGWAGGVDYTITLPSSANVAVRIDRGDLQLANVRGEVRASTVSGNIAGSSLGNLRSARTISGDVSLADIEGETVGAGTLNGDFAIRNLKAQSIDVDVKAGQVRLIDATCIDVYVAAVEGDVDYSGQLAKGGRYRLQSHSGSVRMTPFGDTGFELQANSFSGDIHSDFPFPNSPSPGEPNQTLRGTVGDASATIELRSYSGNVFLSRR
jgi:DUF4097 and DUF4098 domain-containing protein YvlB